MSLARTLVLALSLCVVSVAPAVAQSDPHAVGQEAESHYQTAVRLFGQGRYREALDEFDAAIALSPESIFFCNRAVVLIKLREQRAALENFETCRNTFTGSDEELAQIDAQMLGVRAYVQHVEPRAREVGDLVAAGPLDVQPPRTADKAWQMSDFGYLSLGLGSALLASAATLDLLSADLVEEFRETAEGGSRSRYDELRLEVERRQRIWYGLSIGGGVFALTGLALVTIDFVATMQQRGGDRSSRFWVAPIGGKGGAGLGAGFNF